MAKSKFNTIAFAVAMFVGIFALITPALAQSTISTDGLSPDKIQQIQQIINTGKSATQQVTGILDTNALSTYADLGKAIGQSIAEAAKQIGVAAADFAKTPLGMFAVFLIAWKLMLGDMVTSAIWTIIGIGWLVMILRVWSHYFKKICLVDFVTVETVDRRVKNDDGTWAKNDDGSFMTEKVTNTTTRGFSLDDGSVMGYRFFAILFGAIATIPGWIMIAHA